MFQKMFGRKNKSPNYNERRAGVRPYIILMHYTGMKTGEEAHTRLCDPDAEVSAHYMIEENGKVSQLVDEHHRAWHAGVSGWKGESDINSASIGIELVNPGHEFGYVPFTDAQMKALVKLCKDIMKRWPIRYVLGHSDVAPERKNDPGELFDWRALAAEGIGFWPEPNEADYAAAPDVANCDQTTQNLLKAAGYNTMCGFSELITAFHRHYVPEKFSGEEGVKPEIFDEQSAARLLALVRHEHEMKEKFAHSH